MLFALAITIAAAQKGDISVHKPDKKAVIKTFERSSDVDGNYQYQYESSNGRIFPIIIIVYSYLLIAFYG